MKSYTDIEQSKKLAEILPMESADMYYPWDIDSKSFLNIPIVKDDSYYVQCSIDCWSLAALLDVFPNRIKLCKSDGSKYFIGGLLYDNPIDACYEMVLKLNEQNLL